jgi:hypothetical protein
MLVVCEATGGYETQFRKTFLSHNRLPLSRHSARAGFTRSSPKVSAPSRAHGE